jgi:hypothetical protein
MCPAYRVLLLISPFSPFIPKRTVGSHYRHTFHLPQQVSFQKAIGYRSGAWTAQSVQRLATGRTAEGSEFESR